MPTVGEWVGHLTPNVVYGITQSGSFVASYDSTGTTSQGTTFNSGVTGLTTLYLPSGNYTITAIRTGSGSLLAESHPIVVSSSPVSLNNAGSVRPTVGTPSVATPANPVVVNGVTYTSDQEGDLAYDNTTNANLVTLYFFSASAWSAGISLVVSGSDATVHSLGVNVAASGTVGRLDASVIVAQSKSGAIGALFAGNGTTGGPSYFGGVGAPGAAPAAAVVGDFYFRSDTPTVANQCVYVKTVAPSTWVGKI